MSANTTSAPFSRAVVRAMKRLYPQALSDSSWDNTGLLLEPPFIPSRRQSNVILLTIDLTRAVAEEAISLNSSIIVAYHPIIFRGLKSLTLANSQQETLLRLASHGISVYSPHTAIDAAKGGLGDWLADIVTGTKTTFGPIAGGDVESSPERVQKQLKRKDSDDPFTDKQLRPPVYTLHNHPSQTHIRVSKTTSPTQSTTPHSRRPIVPQSPEIEGHPGAGMGRIVTFEHPQPLPALLDRIGKGLNNPKGFPIAIPQGSTISDISISSVGICAGSGGTLLSDLSVDLLFTGEMSHHEALAAIEKGQVVISLFHSNSERGFLSEVLMGQLEDAVTEEWGKVRGEEEGGDGEGVSEAYEEVDFEVHVSEVDRDPYGIVVLREE
ncbi:NGG1p interacting factor 3 [Amniculicola lignicola CBS 123094]|uniref:NGG1p interacting factor 3 n=1 Tax=Amniculicola lignicola CBS 123094 TaxID=1392246 RepID=A0A6A5X4T7_9PLEO|nr:NGG1p interacting factor 3 [Amniculicola lignicola CBS 123094]